MSAFGIDQGATYSYVGVWQQGNPQIIAYNQENGTPPNYVYLTDANWPIGINEGDIKKELVEDISSEEQFSRPHLNSLTHFEEGIVTSSNEATVNTGIEKEAASRVEVQIEVPLSEWTKKAKLLTAAQAENEKLKEECKIKERIIKELKEIISSMRTTFEMKSKNSEEHNLKKNDVVNSESGRRSKRNSLVGTNQVELEEGVIVDRFALETIRSNLKLNPSRLVRHLTALVFTQEEMLTQSISGRKNNLHKNNKKEPKHCLNIDKLRAIKNELRAILTERKYPKGEFDFAISNCDKYIRIKISTEKEAHKKILQQNSNRENSTAEEIDAPRGKNTNSNIIQVSAPTSKKVENSMELNYRNRGTGSNKLLSPGNSSELNLRNCAENSMNSSEISLSSNCSVDDSDDDVSYTLCLSENESELEKYKVGIETSCPTKEKYPTEANPQVHEKKRRLLNSISQS